VGRGPGVSVSELETGRWRVRWRETLALPDGSRKSAQRERVVDDHATAIALQAKVLRALETGEVPQVDAVREMPAVCSVDQVLDGWLRSCAARGAPASTLRNYAQRNKRLLGALRQRHKIPTDKGVPADLLSREEVVQITLILRERFSESTLNGTIGSLLTAWAWGADDPRAYPGLPVPLHHPEAVIPPAPIYAPIEAPTMAEVDAVLRVLASNRRTRGVALATSTIASRTGLRAGQVLALTVGDINLAASSITVTAGKSRREKAERRTVPLSPALRPFLAELVADREDSEPLIRKRADTKRTDRTLPTDSVRAAWVAATKAGRAREAVWKPPGRDLARPDHAFRAAFQGHLVAQGVRDEVIDLLVGHSIDLRSRHYVDPAARWGMMKAAVETLPDIDWAGPEVEGEVESNVVELRPRG
jgi:integrase